MERSEVLDLAIDHSWDAITVARCSLAGKWLQRRCKAHVQQHLPKLLATAHADASQEYRTHGSCRRDMHRRSIEWLYRTAGRTLVGSVGTATALLCCVNQMPWGLSDVLAMAVEYGVQLTAEAVVAASKARTELFVWVNTFFPLTPSSFLSFVDEQLPQVAAVAATIEPTGEQLQKQMLQAVNSEYLDTLCDLLKHPAAAQVSPEGMQQVLQVLLQLIVRYRQIDDGEVELGPEGDGGPVWLSIRSQAAQAISAAAAAQLMLYCVRQQSPAGLKLVSLLPGVVQLDTKSCESLLQQSLQVVASSRQSLRSFGVLRYLLQLPAVQKLPAEAVGRLLLSGIDSASLQLSTMQLLYQQLPATQHLSCSDVRALLFAAFEQQDKATFTHLRGLPAAPDDDEVQAWCCILGLRRA